MVKANSPALKHLLNYRYLFVTQLVLAIAVVVDYAFDLNIKHSFGNWFYLFIASGELLSVLPLLKDWDIPGLRYLVLGPGFGLLAVFMIYLTDIFGPYFGILILVLFASIYWLGLIGLILGLLVEYLIIVIGAWYQYGNLTGGLPSNILLHALTLTILGVIFERVSLPTRMVANRSATLLESVSFERTRLLSLINSMADAVLATNSQGRVLVYNGATLDLLNTNASLESRYLNSFLKLRNEHHRIVDLLREAKKADIPIKRDDLYFESADGQRVRLYVDIAPIRSPADSRVKEGYIMLLRDITKEKSLEEERSEFISVTSHELRTPIAIAEANISTALLPNFSANLAPNAKSLLEQAHGQVIFLADLVNDLTTLARAERGALALETKPINPTDMLTQLADGYRDEAKQKGLRLTVEADPLAPVNTAELYVQEVLQNFITNALKYTDNGQITLKVEPRKEGGVIFSVKDTGFGISNSDQKRVFQKFYRAEDYRTRKTRGTGLGLYITVKLAEKIGGRVWFKSKLNVGSTFYLEVPPIAVKARSFTPARGLRSFVPQKH